MELQDTGNKLYNIQSVCLNCRGLHGSSTFQLDEERPTPSPPFTNASVDCFGPWDVVTHRTFVVLQVLNNYYDD